MENSQHSLSAVESFSYSWSVNMKAEKLYDDNDNDNDNEEEEAAFIDMDPSLSPSKRFSNVNPRDFINFNFQISSYNHENERISSTTSIMKNMEPSSSVTKKDQEVNNSSSSRRSSSGIGIFQKLLDFLKPLYQKISFGCKSRTSTSVISSTRSVEGLIMNNYKNLGSSEGTSVTPRTSIANYSEDDWRRSCDSESSIYEAVLHCKRTINGDE